MTHLVHADNAQRGNKTTARNSQNVTFVKVFSSEWHKLWWLRSQKWCAAALVILSWATAVFMGNEIQDRLSGVIDPDAIAGQGIDLVYIAGSGWVMLAVPMVLFGIFAITSEFGSGMIRSTVSAVPNRDVLFGAKLLSLALSSLLVAAITVIGTALIAAVVGAGTEFLLLFSPEVILALTLTVITMVAISVCAMCVGWLLRSSSGAISLTLGVLLLLPILFGFLTLTDYKWPAPVATLLPTSLSDTLITSPVSPFNSSEYLFTGAVGGSLGLLIWVVALVISAWVVQRKRAVR